ncbi:anhydro-N-acetylmuramic acid kinase [Aquiflexum sp. TKW24L]|uniref:anhydro-N-acetylmuramic acid kinase n=1 Tax=Aquiflexum sp. TKW24L TaxID=2942212 RepID=UPI0020BFC041|nr:anhydro-N-acetylmuramic acid kinase [Aquiflexum sp. TKW24L]MCL6260891.1 anhydro-N-acetylmuramic acid kinase [Aquiflexum sp. TKW24L]
MKTQSSYKVIGLMSGTSGDGLDIAYCEFEKNDLWTYHIKASETVPFPKKLGKKLMKSHLLNGYKLSLLDVHFGQWMGEQVSIFIKKHQLEVEVLASHGHTVFHQPSKKLSIQIGNGWALHAACGIPVINDFRMLDVQLGGQGAPLVPIGDKMLFPDFDYCINLGGIANISMESEGKRIAFDICPFNLLLNHFAESCGKPYDKDGKLARKGTLLKKELRQLNQLPYYQINGAKSLGREDLEDYLKILDGSEEHKPENVLHTLVIHYAEQINKILIPVLGKKTKVLVTGGGAYNMFFMEKLAALLSPDIEVVQADPLLINFKEALVFSFLGVLKLRDEMNSLASVTGASRDNCGGLVYG